MSLASVKRRHRHRHGVGSKPAVGPVIVTEGLTRRFGRRRGINDVTVAVDRGEVFGFLGPNGAGKSTTMRLLLGLCRPTSGRAAVFGLDPRRHSVELHHRVGYLPGELALFPRLTGRQILSPGNDFHFYVGNQNRRRRSFSVLGVWYPKVEDALF